jgi:2-hydroxy-6-oxonona-2,4-dienedioate hydrolase
MDSPMMFRSGELPSPLSQRYRVIALDQIGFGRSAKPLVNYRVGTFVDFLEGFCKELKVERATFVGNSLGGWVAAAFALKYPNRVERLVLVDAAGFGALVESLGPRTLSALELATREDIRYLGPLTFYHKQFYEGDAILDAAFTQRMSAGDGYTITRFLESMMRREDVLDKRLAALRRPTLVVWGREDKLIPLLFGRQFNQEIIGSRLVIIERCGHMPQVECASEFNTTLLKFLGGE